MCLYPRQFNNRRYEPNLKNGGNIPPLRDRKLLVAPVPCGNCIECRKQKYNDWRVRIIEEIRHDKDVIFVTLTLSTDSIKQLASAVHSTEGEYYGYRLDNAIAKLAVKRFLDRVKHSKRQRSVKHWLVTELGHQQTVHLHLHGFLWTTDASILDKWQYGFTWLGHYATGKTASYVTKYILKTDPMHKEYKPCVLCSPGIGKAYLSSRRAEQHRYTPGRTQELYTAPNGTRSALPRYYRRKLYTDQERENLWAEKMESGKQFVLGEGVSILGNAQEYLDAIKIGRMKNSRLGYGTSRINTARKQRENATREQIQRQRLDTKQSINDNEMDEPDRPR